MLLLRAVPRRAAPCLLPACLLQVSALTAYPLHVHGHEGYKKVRALQAAQAGRTCAAGIVPSWPKMQAGIVTGCTLHSCVASMRTYMRGFPGTPNPAVADRQATALLQRPIAGVRRRLR